MRRSTDRLIYETYETMTTLYVDLKAICPNPELIDIWEQINQEVWDGEQKPCWLSRITSTNYGKHAGYWFPDSRTIQILHTCWERKESIILHEMVHQWVSDNGYEQMPMTWRREFGRGKRTGTWNTNDLDSVHDDPGWLLGVTVAMERMGIQDRIPFIRKKTTCGIAPTVFTDDRKELLILKPETTEHHGKRLVAAKRFPWDAEMNHLAENGWEF